MALSEYIFLHLFHLVCVRNKFSKSLTHAYMFIKHKQPLNHIYNRHTIFKKLPYDMLIKRTFFRLMAKKKKKNFT